VTAVADRVRSRCWLIIAVVSVVRSWLMSSRHVGRVLPAMLLRVGLGFVVAVATNAGTAATSFPGDRAPADTTSRTP
jgi:hypothetical protein